ncbi:MAG: OmpA family protein [bacterium]|nr:OmpA family protein [bacterium]
MRLGQVLFRLHLLALLLLAGCMPYPFTPVEGPDKQASGMLMGGALGAGSGMVITHNLAMSGTRGFITGGSLGVLYGFFAGIGIDLLEEDQLQQIAEIDALSQKLWVQSLLAEHYDRRLRLHPNRDVFPADYFFQSDGSTLTPYSEILVKNLAELNRDRLPWSRIVVASYTTSSDPESPYAHYLSTKRAESIARGLIRYGIEPRRVATKAMTLTEPILIDPQDNPDRYFQAVELIFIDKQ